MNQLMQVFILVLTLVDLIKILNIWVIIDPADTLFLGALAGNGFTFESRCFELNHPPSF